jgi:hypothetical protein
MERLDGDIDEVVSADFARTLERELIAAQKTINQIKLEWEPAPSATRATAPTAVWTCVYNGTVSRPCKICDCEMKVYSPQAAQVESATTDLDEFVRVARTFSDEHYQNALVAELRRVYRAQEETVIGHARYEYLRTLNPREFAALYDDALHGDRFDDLVDRYRDAGGLPK